MPSRSLHTIKRRSHIEHKEVRWREWLWTQAIQAKDDFFITLMELYTRNPKLRTSFRQIFYSILLVQWSLEDFFSTLTSSDGFTSKETSSYEKEPPIQINSFKHVWTCLLEICCALSTSTTNLVLKWPINGKIPSVTERGLPNKGSQTHERFMSSVMPSWSWQCKFCCAEDSSSSISLPLNFDIP